MGTTQLLAAGARTAENLSIFDPASPPADYIRHLFILVLAITGGIFLLVEGVLVYSIIRFREKPNAGTSEPPQVYGSLPIEIAWTAAPGLIVFLLFLLLTRTEFEIRVDPAKPPPGSKPLYVTVVGHQWWWEYRYYDKYYEDFDQAGGQDRLDSGTNQSHVVSDQRARPVSGTVRRRNMPAYGKQLKPAEVTAVVEFLANLRPPGQASPRSPAGHPPVARKTAK